MGRREGAQSIKDAVRSVINRLQVRQEVGGEEDPLDAMKNILTKSELEHIKINYFRKGLIYAYVDSSSWLYTCTLKKEIYLKQIRLACPSVQDIRFRIGEVHETKG
jgi:hypothetical protein